MAKKDKFFFVTALSVILFGIAAYWYCFSNYGDPHLFKNTYGHHTIESLHWQLLPLPVLDGDGTKVFFDLSKNELAIVFDPIKDSGWTILGYENGGLRIGFGEHTVTIPELADRCVLVDESGPRAIRDLKPGEAKKLFERFSMMSNTGKLRADIQSCLPQTAITIPSKGMK